MEKGVTATATQFPAHPALVRNAAWVVGASLLMAVCSRISVPLPFTPIPFTMGNFAVLLTGLVLGSKRGLAAMLLYLGEGLAGAPVFSPAGPGGLAQLLGPTGGYLMAYPVAAFACGYIAEHGRGTIARLAAASVIGEAALFSGGIAWIVALTHFAPGQAVRYGLYPFIFMEAVKVVAASAIAHRVMPLSRRGPGEGTV
jgi:biotin transport system substrate-specific component